MAKTKIQIKTFGGTLLFEYITEDNTIKKTAIEAVKRGAYLRDADLGDADLRSADLGDADLRSADLGDAYLRDADLRDADLRGAYLRDANLRDAYLRGADLRGAYLRGADLRGADLRGADLGGAYLRDANLRDADLRGADLRDADLGGADLRGADLGDAEEYYMSHEFCIEIIRRQKIKDFTSKEWEIIGQIAVSRICWEEIKKQYGKKILSLLKKIAKLGFKEYLTHYEKI